MKIIMTPNAVKDLISTDSLPLYMVMNMDVTNGVLNVQTFQKSLEVADKITETLKSADLTVGRVGERMFDAYRQFIFDNVRTLKHPVVFEDENFSIEAVHEMVYEGKKQ